MRACLEKSRSWVQNQSAVKSPISSRGVLISLEHYPVDVCFPRQPLSEIAGSLDQIREALPGFEVELKLARGKSRRAGEVGNRSQEVRQRIPRDLAAQLHSRQARVAEMRAGANPACDGVIHHGGKPRERPGPGLGALVGGGETEIVTIETQQHFDRRGRERARPRRILGMIRSVQKRRP